MAASVLHTNFGGMLCHEVRGGVQRTYVHDEIGNTSYLVDSTTVTDTYTYSPYGQVSHTGSNVTPFTFIGALGYFATGWSVMTSYVRARWYSSVSGQWGSVDPIWPMEPAYQYVDGNPAMRVDPTGLADNNCNVDILRSVGTIAFAVMNGESPFAVFCRMAKACIQPLLAALFITVLAILSSGVGPAGTVAGGLLGTALAGCIAGAIAGLLGTMLEEACKQQENCYKPPRPDCFAAKSAFSALAGCLGGTLRFAGVSQAVNFFISNFLGIANSEFSFGCNENGGFHLPGG